MFCFSSCSFSFSHHLAPLPLWGGPVGQGPADCLAYRYDTPDTRPDSRRDPRRQTGDRYRRSRVLADSPSTQSLLQPPDKYRVQVESASVLKEPPRRRPGAIRGASGKISPDIRRRAGRKRNPPPGLLATSLSPSSPARGRYSRGYPGRTRNSGPLPGPKYCLTFPCSRDEPESGRSSGARYWGPRPASPSSSGRGSRKPGGLRCRSTGVRILLLRSVLRPRGPGAPPRLPRCGRHCRRRGRHCRPPRPHAVATRRLTPSRCAALPRGRPGPGRGRAGR